MKIRILAIFLACAAGSLAHAGPFSDMGTMMGGMTGAWNDNRSGRNLDQTLENVSAYLNRDVPITLDSDTRLDRVTAEPGRRLSYHYTLTSLQAKDIRRADFQKTIRGPIQARLCESTEMRGFLKRGVTISYYYRASDGQPLGLTRFTASDCGLQVS